MKRALLFLVFAAGCSFPSVEIVPADSESTDSTAFETSSSETGADSETDSTIAPDAETDTATGDAKSDTVVATDTDTGADAKSDAATCPPGSKTTDPCDCDGDGDRKKGGACGGTDCDDNDARANGKVTSFLTFTPTTTTKGDWDCDGTPKKQFDENISCASILDLGTCAGKKGFTATVACGAAGTFVTCKSTGLGCTTDTSKTDTQGCK